MSKYLSNAITTVSSNVTLKNAAYVEQIRINYSNAFEKIYSGETLDFSVIFNKRDLTNITLGYLISNQKNQNLLAANMQQYDTKFLALDTKNELRVVVENLPLAPGVYSLSIFFGNGAFDVDIHRNVLTFKVSWSDGTKVIKPNPKWGNVYAKTKWIY